MTAWTWVGLTLFSVAAVISPLIVWRRGRPVLAFFLELWCLINVVDRVPRWLLVAVVASPFFYLVQAAALLVLVGTVWRALSRR